MLRLFRLLMLLFSQLHLNLAFRLIANVVFIISKNLLPTVHSIAFKPYLGYHQHVGHFNCSNQWRHLFFLILVWHYYHNSATAKYDHLNWRVHWHHDCCWENHHPSPCLLRHHRPHPIQSLQLKPHLAYQHSHF
jgi:hypothetical protein